MVTNKTANKINLFNKMVYVHKMAITKTYLKAFNTFNDTLTTINDRTLRSLTNI